MAINTAKLLPSSQAGKLAIYQGKGRTNLGMSLGDQSGQVLVVKKQVIRIENLIKRKYVDQIKLQKDEDKKREQRRRSEKEKRLEKTPKENTGEKLPGVPLPKLGFLDGIKNFIGNMILGFIAFRLIEHLPKLMKVVKFLAPAVDWFIDFSGKVLNALVTFVDWGYKAYDATRGFIKNIFGEGGAAQFDQLSGALNKFLNLAIIAGMVVASGRGGGIGGGIGGGRGGGGRGTVSISGRGAGRVPTTSPSAARRYAERFGIDAAKRKFGQEAVESLGGKFARSGATNLARKGFMSLAGKGGAKMILKFTKPLLKRIPIIGGLIDFGLSVALGEDPGRAAFKAIGATLVGAIGAAIGSLAFGAGGIIGGIIGSIGGDMLGGALYDMFFSGKKPQPKGNTQGRASGGGITRGKKLPGGIKREAPTKKDITRTIKVQSSELNPGKGVGGEKKIKNFYPEVKPGKSNVLDYQKNTYKKLSDIPFVGPLLGIAIKAIAGDKPSSADYTNVGVGLNNWLNTTFNTETMRSGGLAMAEGGEVNSRLFMMGGDMSNIITKSLEESISKKVDDAINDMRKKLGLEPLGVEKKTGERGDGENGIDDGSLGTSDAPGAPGSANAGWARIYELARKAGDPFPEVTASQWAIESGYGKYKTGKNNPFGQTGTHPQYGGITLATPRDPGGGSKTFMNFGSETEAVQFRVKRWVPEYKSAKTPREALMMIQKYGKSGRYAQGWPTRQFPQGDWMGYVRSVERIMTDNGGNPLRMRVPGAAAPALMGDPNIAGRGTGSGYGSGGVKIAGDLGDFMKANRGKIGITGSIHQHPRHPGQFTRSYFSYHNQNRALDIGGYGPNHRGSGGRDEQAPVIRALLNWNRQNKYTPIEIIHGSPTFRNLGRYESAPNALHADHVHVAYAKGGRVRMKTFAMLAEKGPEFVFDADSTASIDRAAPMLLDKLNAASSVQGIVQILKGYGYDDAEEPPTPAPAPPTPPESESMPPQTNFVMLGGAGGGSDSRFDILEKLPG